MKKIILLYLTLLPISSFVSRFYIMGYPVITFFELGLYALSIMYTILFLTNRRRAIDVLMFFGLLASLSITMVHSLIAGWPLMLCVTNSAMYYLPFTIYPMVKIHKITLDEFMRWFTFSIIAAAGISILVYLGTWGNGYSSSFQYNINTAYVDGASGVLAIIISLYRLLNRNTSYNLRTTLIMGVCGSIVVLFGQSRGRLLIALFEIALVLCMYRYVHGKFNGQEIMRALGIACVIAISIGFLLRSSSDNTDYIERIMQRLASTNSEETNVNYRLVEMGQYLELFKKNPIFGTGWGLLNNKSYLNAAGLPYQAHNMYFALLGITGLSYTILFVWILLRVFFNTVRGVIRQKSETYVIACTSLVGILLLGVANAGFGKLAGLLYVVVTYTVSNEKFYNNRGRIHEKSRHPYLS